MAPAKRTLTPLAAFVAAAAVPSLLTFWLVPSVRQMTLSGAPAFEYLFLRDEPKAALLAAGIAAAAAVAAALWRSMPERVFVGRLAADPRAFAAAFTLVLAVAAVAVYRMHALSMDEYAPLFQARVFARGALFGRAPPELVPRLVPPYRWFIESSPDGRMVSAYWPGFALLLTPFVWVHATWLLNPIVGGLSLLLVWRVARRIWPEGAAPGWAVLFTAASPAFTVNAISYYSMSAHLLASLCFASLLIDPTPRRLLLAGAVGSFALSLHNPLPHALFALPWIASLLWRPARVRNLSLLAAGYLPGTAALIAGWMLVRGQIGAAREVAAGGLAEKLSALVRLAFDLPDARLLWDRAINVAELNNWAAPGLVALACYGAWRFRHHRPLRLFALSAALTFAAYFLVPYDQGHGWGYRYLHAAWGAFPLLAAGAVESIDAPSLRRAAGVAAVLGVVLATALRFVQVRTYIDRHLAQLPQAPRSAPLEIVFVRLDRGYYMQVRVQNDPFMEGTRWILISRGPREDSLFVERSFSGRGRRVARTDAAELWQID